MKYFHSSIGYRLAKAAFLVALFVLIVFLEKTPTNLQASFVPFDLKLPLLVVLAYGLGTRFFFVLLLLSCVLLWFRVAEWMPMPPTLLAIGISAWLGSYSLGFLMSRLKKGSPFSELFTIVTTSLIASGTEWMIVFLLMYFVPDLLSHRLDPIELSMMRSFVGCSVALPFLLEINRIKVFWPSSRRIFYILVMLASSLLSIFALVNFNNSYFVVFFYLPCFLASLSRDRLLIFLACSFSSISMLFSGVTSQSAFMDLALPGGILGLQVSILSLALTSIELAAVSQYRGNRRVHMIVLIGWLLTSLLFGFLYLEKQHLARSNSNLDLAIIAAMGLFITLVVAKVLFATSEAQAKAEQLAMEKSRLLIRQMRLWHVLTENASVGIFQMNDKDVVSYSNPFWIKLFGNKLESLTSKERWEFVHLGDRERMAKAWSESLKDRSVIEQEYRILGVDGQVHWLHLIASHIHDDQGEFEGVVAIAFDVSSKKEAESLLQSERARTVQTAKMVSLGQMAAGIAHEINNPLALINAVAINLRQHLRPADSEALAGVDKIEKMGLRITKIIKGLLAFARNGENDPLENVRLEDIVNESLELCRQDFRRNEIELRVASAPDVLIRGRPVQLSQIIVVLLNNAFDAVRDLDERWIEIDFEPQGASILIRVSNSGKIIESDVAERIFEPFFTTKEVGRGVGIGLSIAQSIARGHFGSLSYEAFKGHTSFVLSLPSQEIGASSFE